MEHHHTSEKKSFTYCERIENKLEQKSGKGDKNQKS